MLRLKKYNSRNESQKSYKKKNIESQVFIQGFMQSKWIIIL